jgi:hypothetical protein
MKIALTKEYNKRKSEKEKGKNNNEKRQVCNLLKFISLQKRIQESVSDSCIFLLRCAVLCLINRLRKEILISKTKKSYVFR